MNKTYVLIILYSIGALLPAAAPATHLPISILPPRVVDTRNTGVFGLELHTEMVDTIGRMEEITQASLNQEKLDHAIECITHALISLNRVTENITQQPEKALTAKKPAHLMRVIHAQSDKIISFYMTLCLFLIEWGKERSQIIMTDYKTFSRILDAESSLLRKLFQFRRKLARLRLPQA